MKMAGEGGLEGFVRRNGRYLIPLALFLFAFVPRFFYMSDGLWHTDSVIMAKAVEETFNAKSLAYMHGSGYPGQVVVSVIVYSIHRLLTGVESSEFAVTFVSVLASSLAVVALYFFVREVAESKWTAVFSATIFSVIPVFFSASTFAKSHAAALFFLILSAYLAARSGRTDSIRDRMLSGFCFGFSSAIRFSMLPLAPIIILLHYHKKFPINLVREKGLMKIKLAEGGEKIARDLSYIIIPVLLVLALLYTPMYLRDGFKPIVEAAQYNRFMGVQSYLTNLSLDWAYVSINWLGGLLALGGIVCAFRRNRYLGVVLILWSVMFFIYYANTRTTSPRHVLPSFIPAAILMGIALNELYERVGNIAAALPLLAVMYLMASTIYPIVEYRADFCGPKEFSLKVKELTETNAVILVMDESHHIEYYANRSIRGHPVGGDPNKLGEHMLEIKKLLEDDTPVYAASTTFSYDNPQGLSYDPRSGRIVDAQRGIAYDKVDYDPTTKRVRDPDTGAVLGFTGRYMITLLSNFKLELIGSYPNEDWHKKSIYLNPGEEQLYKLTIR